MVGRFEKIGTGKFEVGGLWDWFQGLIKRYGRQPKVGLALGSGASWGVAHVGVLSVFHDLQIRISFLSGSSSGSFVGALYVGGIEGELLEACGKEYRWRDAGKFNYFPKMGIATNDRMASYLEKKIGNPHFEDLRIPFFVAATNLTTGTIKIFNKGPVLPAVQASCAMPGIFAPVEVEGELYCDGGLLNKVPCQILKDAGADIVIGVVLSSSIQMKRPTNLVEVIGRSFDIALFRQAFSDCKSADLIVRPNVSDIYEFGFEQNEILIQRGKEAIINSLKQKEEFLPSLNIPKPDSFRE